MALWTEHDAHSPPIDHQVRPTTLDRSRHWFWVKVTDGCDHYYPKWAKAPPSQACTAGPGPPGTEKEMARGARDKTCCKGKDKGCGDHFLINPTDKNRMTGGPWLSWNDHSAPVSFELIAFIISMEVTCIFSFEWCSIFCFSYWIRLLGFWWDWWNGSWFSDSPRVYRKW